VAANRVSELYRTAFITGASTGSGRAFTAAARRRRPAWGTSRDAPGWAICRRRTAQLTAITLDLRNGTAAEEASASPITTPAAWIRHQQRGLRRVRRVRVGRLCGLAGTAGGDADQLRSLSHARWSGCSREITARWSTSPRWPPSFLPFQSAYNMTKAGLTALSESLMLETANTGVVVLDIRPGDYRTDF
jgi:NAD(P)-dependent dehydrogenase (short-subunit alcohol dehydrogenase family)